MNSWPQRLAEDHPDRGAAIQELRDTLLRGLRTELSGRAGMDQAFLEDIVQNALLRILDRLETFEGRGPFIFWALSISFRVAFDELRRREWGHVSLNTLQELHTCPSVTADPAEAPDKAAERRDLASFLRTVIRSELTSRQRDLLLCELEGMPQEEIARQFGTNRGHIYKLFHDARQALKHALETRGHLPSVGVACQSKGQNSMRLTPKHIDDLIRLIGITREQELNCDECLDQVSEFAECQLVGRPIPAALKAVEHHLEICAECREEYGALQRVLEDLKGSATDHDIQGGGHS